MTYRDIGFIGNNANRCQFCPCTTLKWTIRAICITSATTRHLLPHTWITFGAHLHHRCIRREYALDTALHHLQRLRRPASTSNRSIKTQAFLSPEVTALTHYSTWNNSQSGSILRILVPENPCSDFPPAGSPTLPPAQQATRSSIIPRGIVCSHVQRHAPAT